MCDPYVKETFRTAINPSSSSPFHVVGKPVPGTSQNMTLR